jgi:hypothetical protein
MLLVFAYLAYSAKMISVSRISGIQGAEQEGVWSEGISN